MKRWEGGMVKKENKGEESGREKIVKNSMKSESGASGNVGEGRNGSTDPFPIQPFPPSLSSPFFSTKEVCSCKSLWSSVSNTVLGSNQLCHLTHSYCGKKKKKR